VADSNDENLLTVRCLVVRGEKRIVSVLRLFQARPLESDENNSDRYNSWEESNGRCE
jgi:hypothetical protein